MDVLAVLRKAAVAASEARRTAKPGAAPEAGEAFAGRTAKSGCTGTAAAKAMAENIL